MTQLSESADAYLAVLEAPGLVRDRVGKILDMYASMFPLIEFDDLFICDRLDEDGDRQFESLWIFASNAVGECRNVGMEVRNEVWDLADWGRVKLASFESQNFVPQVGADRGARLSVEWSNDLQLGGRLYATGLNCTYLEQSVRKYLLPRLGPV